MTFDALLRLKFLEFSFKPSWKENLIFLSSSLSELSLLTFLLERRDITNICVITRQRNLGSWRLFLSKMSFQRSLGFKKICEKLTSLSEWISTVGCAVLWWWSACVGVDCNDGDAIVTGAVDVWLLVWVACELLCCWPADDGVLLTGCCCFFFNAS